MEIDEMLEKVINEQRGRDPIVLDTQLFFALVDAAKSAPRWIPVSERLPELEPGNITKTIRVLCTYIRYDVRVVFESVWDEEREHFYWDFAADYPATFSAPDFTNGNERIIAWQYMPRPALPEEVEG